MPTIQRPNATVYAISCLPGMTHQTTNTQHCNWTTSITLTEGPSTLVYTKTYADECVIHSLYHTALPPGGLPTNSQAEKRTLPPPPPNTPPSTASCPVRPPPQR